MSTSTLPEQYWTIPRAAEFWDCSELTIRRAIWDGRLKARKVGRVIRLDPRDVAKLGAPIKVYRPATEAGGDLD